MDFHLSKENIQPLRGGRNAEQLEVALQAQHDPEMQQELLQARQHYECVIRNYTGPDPLNNYFQYILWVEQCYPKHGHEGHLAQLLEDCIVKFENDKTYMNDRRFCKIWIKYIDMQKNNVELYQMLYNKGICVGWADLYKAWAFYHQAVGDFVNADKVFNLGIKNLAQPYEDLLAAQREMYINAGLQSLHGLDKNRLAEQRQALTSLSTYKLGFVNSVRTPAGGPGVLPSSNAPTAHSNASGVVNVFESHEPVPFAVGAPPTSVLSAVVRDGPKENICNPGPWSSSKKSAPTPRKTATIQVHEDSEVPPHELGLKLPMGHATQTIEDFSDWHVSITYPDPDDPKKTSMYPKADVYSDPSTEYSLEELRARRYMRKSSNNRASAYQLVSMEETMNVAAGQLHRAAPSLYFVPNETPNRSVEQRRAVTSTSVLQKTLEAPTAEEDSMFGQRAANRTNQPPACNLWSTFQDERNETNPVALPRTSQMSAFQVYQESMIEQPNDDAHETTLQGQQGLQLEREQHQLHSPIAVFQPTNRPVCQSDQSTSVLTTNVLAQSQPQDSPMAHSNVVCNLWSTFQDEANETSTTIPTPPKPTAPMSTFQIYQESMFEQPGGGAASSDQYQPGAGSAMKTPFKTLNADDIAETGSRGGLDAAAAAQPTDCAIFDVDESAILCNFSDFNATNTEIFHLNAMHVSTPNNKRQTQHLVASNLDASITKKKLFTFSDNKMLSDIAEERSLGSSGHQSSSMGTTHRSTSRAPTMEPIEEQMKYDFNLSQNMKANAELRLKLGIDVDSPSGSPRFVNNQFAVASDAEYVENEAQVDQQYTPYPVLDVQTSDPFRPKVIEKLLEHVGFPGRHSDGFVQLASMPKVQVRRDPMFIGSDRYLLEKLLGRGTFANVYKATKWDAQRQVVALKVQRPANRWEFYICREVRSRLLKHPLANRFMDVRTAYFSEHASALVSEYCAGSLLDLFNGLKHKLSKAPKHNLTIYLTIEMIRIVQALHSVKVIHADIKPDNFLVMMPHDELQLQLIDFGCSIDMSLYPEDKQFTRVISTETFTCCEMKDGRPWNYHTDLFCIAATTHVLLLDSYIDLKKVDGRWSITKKIPRYFREDLWNSFFSSLLNMQDGLPDLNHLVDFLYEALEEKDLRSAIRDVNIFIKNV